MERQSGRNKDKKDVKGTLKKKRPTHTFPFSSYRHDGVFRMNVLLKMKFTYFLLKAKHSAAKRIKSAIAFAYIHRCRHTQVQVQNC